MKIVKYPDKRLHEVSKEVVNGTQQYLLNGMIMTGY